MIYIFDDCKINTRLYTLQRLGETTRLRPKVFEVLIYLLEHRDNVISKQELAEQVWPDQFIADSTLESTIRALRQALGDSGREQRVIQTLPGRGYRFIGQITEHGEAPASEAPQAEVSGAPAAQNLTTAAPTSIAPMGRERWRCPTCQHHNVGHPTEDKQLCAACSSAIQPPCPRCGATNHPQANFCSSCGVALTEPLSTSPPLSRAPATDLIPAPPIDPQAIQSDLPEAERRQLTVMSCDLVDAATLLAQLELEDLRDVTHAYHHTCADVARRFGGYIAQRLGTKLLIYFGYPVAHEDDARRGVQAGLGLIEALNTLNTQLVQDNRPRLAVQLGIHTGLVVVEEQGGGDRHDTVAFGEPLTIAAQLQGFSPPNAVVISAATAHLIQGYFACQDIGLHRLKGVTEPVRLSRVIEASGAQSRLEIVGPVGLTPFVGRDTEITLLLERWAQVQDGSGHVVLLSGEAGIGKSRLVQVMQEHLTENAYILLDLRCLPSYQNSAMYPVIDFLHRRVLQWRQDDTPKEKLKKLETTLAQYEVPLDEIFPLLAALLSLPHPGHRYPPLPLTPQQQREKTLGAIVTVILALASRQPMLLMVEDLHWVDPSTLELLTLLVDQTPAAPICTLLTFRPTFDVPWGNRSYLTHVTLTRLSRRQVLQMVTRVAGGQSLPGALLQQVVDQTDGVPLFVEECTKSILETGLLQKTADHYELAESLPTLTIPTTLHDSLMARLDRLDTAKNVAQLGATIGRQVPYALLRAVWQQDEKILQHELARLVAAELVYQRGLPPQATYVFKHALIQEAAYQSLLKRTRQHYHQQIAQVLDEQFPETAVLEPELLAHHYTEAGLYGRAIPYWQQAGEDAVKRSANAEAVSHLTKGLELLKRLPATLERGQQELALQLAMSQPLKMIKGHTAPEVERVYTQTYKLSQLVEDSPQQFSTLVSLWSFYLNQGRICQARELAEQCLTLAQRVQDQNLLQYAHRILGITLFFLGDPPLSLVHLEQGLALYKARPSHRYTSISGVHPGVVYHSYTARVLWMLGYPDQALTQSHEALVLAQESSQPYTLGFALQYAALIYQVCRDAQRVQEIAETTITLARQHGFVQWLAGGMCELGWALAEQGFIEEGIEQLIKGMATWQTVGTELARTHYLSRIAEAYGKRGQVEAGLQMLDEAFAAMDNSDERHYETELYRLKGNLLLQRHVENTPPHTVSPASPLLSTVEAAFCHALDVARHRQAKSLELRAAMSLSRLWKQQGKRVEAYRMLTDIYHWFTEGFETPDLQEAKTLLDELV